jgi:hypothetical protein
VQQRETVIAAVKLKDGQARSRLDNTLTSLKKSLLVVLIGESHLLLKCLDPVVLCHRRKRNRRYNKGTNVEQVLGGKQRRNRSSRAYDKVRTLLFRHVIYQSFYLFSRLHVSHR